MSWASSDAARAVMQGNKRRDTRPELVVRRLLHAAGLRYRVDFAPLGGRRRADIVFTRKRIAIFIDGCFWHGCPIHATRPKVNADYWWPKLDRNKQRDHETTAALESAGWLVLRFWEHEAPTAVATTITRAVRSR
jgi:DNA mismatch endonuclease (patch repair protein)